MQKEAALDADQHSDKEVIVTAAYKKKLDEMRERMEAEEQEKRKGKEEGPKKDMGGFYKHLFKADVTGGRMSERRTVNENREDEQVKRYGHDASKKSTTESDDDEPAFGPTRRM